MYPMSIWGATDAFEMPGSRTESYNRSEMTAKVTLICPWASRDNTIGQIIRTRYPLPPQAAETYFPAYPKSFDVSVWEEKGSPSDTNAVTYTQAKIDVSYTCRARNASFWEQTFSQTCSPILNMQRLPPWGFYWMTDNMPVVDEEAPTRLNIMLKITRQLSGISVVPAWFHELAGCVNESPWQDVITGIVFSAQTLLFTPSSATKQLTTNPDDIDNVWDMAFELLWNPIGWNRFMRLNSPTVMQGIRIDQMMFAGQPYLMYQPKPFLFTI